MESGSNHKKTRVRTIADIDFKKIRTIPIHQRKNKVKLENLAKIDAKIKPLKNKHLKELSQNIISAYKSDKQVILMMGAHVIKTGVAPYIIDLIKKGVVTHVAMNGAGSIHDFEIAMIGETSEDVHETIKDGSFGMVEETGRMMNEALKSSKEGYGKTIGKLIHDSNFKYKEYSILNTCYELNTPVTVHVAIGTDIIHQHPSCDGEALGRATYKDFKIFVDSVTKLEQGVIVNVGSAVLLPEVFLKALSIARNLEYKVADFTAANMDMKDNYRPRVNVVERPTAIAGKGYFIKGKHERTIPTLYSLIIKGLK